MYYKCFFFFYRVLYFIVSPLFLQFYNICFYFFQNSQPQLVLEMFLILAQNKAHVLINLVLIKKKECEDYVTENNQTKRPYIFHAQRC